MYRFIIPSSLHNNENFSMIDNIATDASVSQIQFGTKPTYRANDGDVTSCFKQQGTNIQIQVDMNEIRIVTELFFTGKGMSVYRLLK